jgi:two-component system, NtrC family, sensor kinase
MRRVLEAMARREEELDLPYLAENLPPAMERSLEGLERIGTIVRSMKEFAHPDQRERVAVDLNRAVSSTIVIARNEYKYVADVVTDLGELPRVPCYAGELNQVVLNLVVNAAHAIADRHGDSGIRGTIRVRTWCEDGQAVISVSDDGAGIPEEIRDRIFDPFFTTKEVGKGTGQGLAIARSVVDKHGGRLDCDSVVGEGTTFTIRLPLEPDRAGSVPVFTGEEERA